MSSPGPYTVLNESLIGWGGVADAGLACVGGGASTNTPRYAHQNMGFVHEFGANQISPVTNVPIGIPTIPTGLRALRIGKYVAQPGADYPGDEYVSAYLGVLDTVGVCAGTASPSLHAVSGVGTAGGFLVVLFNLELPYLVFDALDLHDMNVLTPAGFVPGFGSVFGSERVWSLALE